ncbi:hypothetical protein P168DRAFT_277161, partial [Aspergillus campestris IBT 28561]
MRFPRRKGPAGPVLAVRRTGQPDPRFNYGFLTATTLIYAIGAGITRLLAPDLPPIVPR